MPAVASMEAFGTTSQDFQSYSMGELLDAACRGGTDKPYSEQHMNGVLAAMHGIAPRDEIEGMLAAQMVATHIASIKALRRLKNSETVPQQDSNGNLAIKLMRTFTAQMEALNRYRGKGQQKMTVEHVHVHAGGQAIVGNVTHPEGGGVQKKTEEQPHAITHAPEQEMPSQNTKREAVPVPSDVCCSVVFISSMASDKDCLESNSMPHIFLTLCKCLGEMPTPRVTISISMPRLQILKCSMVNSGSDMPMRCILISSCLS